MKSFILIFVTVLASSCSFDNKTGIWKDASIITDENITRPVGDTDQVNQYEYIFTKKKIFNEEQNLQDDFNFKLTPPVRINYWLEEYGSKTNNISNFLYSGNRTLVSKSSRLSKASLNKNIIFYKNNLVNYDHKGKIFIYSLSVKKKYLNLIFIKVILKNLRKRCLLR
tara:strand:- start:3602 stop:4105 length:504 start_codon:yes stop_codon:yes gene_type:complete